MDESDLIKIGLMTVTAVVAAVTLFYKVVRPEWDRRQRIRSFDRGPVRGLYGKDDILRNSEHYLEPRCQNIDPAGQEDFRKAAPVQEPAFHALDRLLSRPADHKFVIVLAGSGMGKTSLLMNYYARHWRSAKRRKHYNIEIIPLGLGDADAQIEKIPEADRPRTVLFLDALDEDRKAIEDHRARVATLFEQTRAFRSVFMTCRTQFFPKEEEIPSETGVIRVGPVHAGESRMYDCHKIYLAPFSDDEVAQYLTKLFGWRQRGDRAKADAIVAKVWDLVARPMLLAYIQDLVRVDTKVTYAYQVYEVLVDAWIMREKGFVSDTAALREFSEVLAVDLFINRRRRGMERIPYAELEPLARQHGIKLESWELGGRSLLNRDASQNFKFAHRSIQEHLVMERFLAGRMPDHDEVWTSVMESFFLEAMDAKRSSAGVGAQLPVVNRPGVNFDEADLPGADLRGARLSGGRLWKADLTNARLSAADLSEANLGLARLWKTDLREANLSAARLLNAYLEEAKLGKADLTKAKLWKADLTKADLTEANLTKADLTRANLTKADLTKANLCGANLYSADLTGANLREANLSTADLTGANLKGANLTHALELTVHQLAHAIGDCRTRLPDGLPPPAAWSGRGASA